MSVYAGPQNQVTNVFISYSRIDRIRTNGLGLLLEAMGHKVFHDHRTIRPGMKWEAALQQGLDEADSLMIFWTKHAARSDWVRKEYEYFSVHYPDRPLVPVLGDETPLPELLAARQQADFAPLVNEVLALKREMKKQGAGALEVQRAVVKRLDDAGIEMKTKKERRMLALFLGFGWLATLLRFPRASVQRMGRTAVERTAQMTAAQVAAIGLTAVVGLSAGEPVVDNMIRPALKRISGAFPAKGTGSESGEASRGDATSPEAPDVILGTAELPPDAGLADSLLDFRAGLLETQDTINVRLAEITRRLDDLSPELVDVSFAQCRTENQQLRDQVRRLESLAAAGASRPTDRTQPSDPAAATVAGAPGVGSAPSQPIRLAGGSELRYDPVDGDADVIDPVVIVAPHPEYPEAARSRGMEGTVSISGWIDEAGDVTVESSDGVAVFVDASNHAVRQWKFKPGTRNGVPMARRFTVDIVFSIRG